MQENSNQKLIQEALRLAATPAGKQLLALLKQKNGDALSNVMEQTSAGHFESAKQTLAQLLNDPQAQKLLEELRR